MYQKESTQRQGQPASDGTILIQPQDNYILWDSLHVTLSYYTKLQQFVALNTQ